MPPGGYPSNTSLYDETGCLNGSGGPCLQVGYCDPANMAGCNGIGVTRTMFKMPLPTTLPHNISVDTAGLYLENVWTAACTSEPLQLWTAPAIKKGYTDWSNSHDWSSYSQLQELTFNGYGNPCGPGYKAPDVTFSASALGALIQKDLDKSTPDTYQTFGLKAADESTTDGTAWLQWRQFMTKATSGSMELQFTWHNPPTISGTGSNPGGACQTSQASAAQIGNDDLDLYATVGDKDGETPNTTFSVYIPGDTTPVWQQTVPGTGAIQSPSISRTTIKGWQSGGDTTAYTYDYTAVTTNGYGQSATAGPCYFTYNPTGPQAPTVTTGGQPGFPSSVTLGEQIANVTFAPPSGLTCPGDANCPASYTYQLGARAPVTVNSSTTGWDTTNDSWTGTITIPILGPFQLSVSATSTVGNPGVPFTTPVDSTPPAGSPLADGYFSNGNYPDLLFTGTVTGTGTKPSLWLAQGTGSGQVGPAVDIGSLGNGINPGSDGPGDWANAVILHGDFTGDHVQDILAYYPNGTDGSGTDAGAGEILAGDGAAITASPGSDFWPSGSNFGIQSGTLCDFSFDGCASQASQLAAAGDASQQNTGYTDLIGVLGSGGCSANPQGYELAMFTTTTPNGYNPPFQLSTAGPDTGDPCWGDYRLATVQLPDAAYPHGDPANTALFAYNTTTGTLWESVNPNAGNPPAGVDCTQTPSQCTLIGTSTSTTTTWTQISTTAVPWPAATQFASGAATLISADVTNGATGSGIPTGQGTGSPELWVRTGSTVTSYQLSANALTTSYSSSIAPPANDWPLNDGDPSLPSGPSATTALDTITGNAAPISGAYTWTSDPQFSTVLDLSNATSASAYITPPATTIPATDTTPVISVWFKTTVPDGVIASLQSQAVSTSATVSGGYNPVLYIGDDGKLYGEWYAGSSSSAIPSLAPVDDGLWHHAVLTGTGSTQTLYLDGQKQGSLAGSINVSTWGGATNLTFGTGYIGGGWPNEKYSGKTGTLDYFNGQLSSIVFANNPAPGGYWSYSAHGNIHNEAGATYYGSPSSSGISNGVGMAVTPDGKGYWFIASDGTVYPYGDATTGTSATYTNPLIGATSDLATTGYWSYSAHGNIHAKAGATYYGSPSSSGITNGAAMAATPTGKGYWFITSDGTVYPYGDATTVANISPPSGCPIIGATTDPAGGFWAYTACGNIYNKGTAPWYGSKAGAITNAAGLAATADGQGYWLVASNGTVYAYGDATGSTSGTYTNPLIGAVGNPTMTSP